MTMPTFSPGVEPEAGNDGQRSFRTGSIVQIEVPKTIADGAQTQHLGNVTFPIILRDVQDVLTATDAELVDCMRFMASRMIHVECSASGTEESMDPTVIWFGARRVAVCSVTDRWYGSDQRWWKVETAEGFYIVRLDELSRTWELAAVARGES
jgi:hypothetical protein